MQPQQIVIRGAREHNLKGIDVAIPRDKLVVLTGLSGSGKSSLAFDTLYAEGQRRYVESLSAYARQFLEQMGKPDVDSIEGLSPAISIEQKTTSKNPRSTVATVTEVYDYLRLLFARIGIPHCPECGDPIAAQTVQQMVDAVERMAEGTRILVLAPIVRGRKGEYKRELAALRKQGFVRVRVDGEVRELEEDISLDKNLKHDIDVVVDRLIVREGMRKRLTDSVETALKLAEGLLTIHEVGGEAGEGGSDRLFSERHACNRCGVSLPELAPRIFSFNSPHGACPACDGLGSHMEVDPELVVPDAGKSLAEGAIAPWRRTWSAYFEQVLEGLARHYRIPLDRSWGKLKEEQRRVILHGSGDTPITFRLEKEGGSKYSFTKPFEGVVGNLSRRYHETSSGQMREEIGAYMAARPCPDCNGQRLKAISRAVTVAGRSIVEMTAMSIDEACDFFAGLPLSERERFIGERVLKEIGERLSFLRDVGLNYLTLDRSAATLSGGEGQRIRLATQIGSRLTGVMYVLDEPSIGLHQRDNTRLLHTLTTLRDLGNTVIVVEHDEETILAADYVIDMGPGAGHRGGEVVAEGTPKQVAAEEKSLTGQYLSGKRRIALPYRERSPRGFLEILGAKENNLKNVDASLPLGMFTAVTGVSGSGKSTLILEILYKHLARFFHAAGDRPGACTAVRGLQHLDKVIHIDQGPIGRTPRSNPATYTGLFTLIRDLFAVVPESRARGYKAGRYSFNVKGGRCEACQGDGLIKIEMHFLPDVFVTCEACKGRRYNRETLEILWRDKNIADVLEMEVEEAFDFFKAVPAIRRKLLTLMDVGLEYVKLGQSATTLSGGEAQRVKLSRELSRRDTGRTLYLLDEPTTGLHFADVQKLLNVLDRLVEAGNTVVVIEHNLDVIRCADWIVDLGPEGGGGGGTIVAQGPPKKVAAVAESHTGRYLKGVLGR
ncbi:MAG: excinuclease ABC subunit UvrA [Nitrospirota bacterium]|nr:excinuclease ABC subunit UvrA [Nitrospirota bacterium]